MSGHNDREGTASFQATADRSCSPSHQLAVSSTPTSDPDRVRTCDLRFRKPLLYLWLRFQGKTDEGVANEATNPAFCFASPLPQTLSAF